MLSKLLFQDYKFQQLNDLASVHYTHMQGKLAKPLVTSDKGPEAVHWCNEFASFLFPEILDHAGSLSRPQSISRL